MDYNIKYLFIRYINGQCSEHELDEVWALIENGTHHAEWEAAITEDAESLHSLDTESRLESSDIERIYSRIETSLFPEGRHKVSSRPGRIFPLWRAVSAAVAILIVISAGYLFFKSGFTKKAEPANAINVHPGGNKAFLTLSNGKKISLTDAANGKIAAQPGIKIIKTADGRIIYTNENTLSGKELAQYNTIETPKGGQFQVRLPDGTSVWLNAASTLIYPVSFRGSRERKVQLDGEAYFEVAKDKAHPFIVTTGGQEVQVLGTHFNINGYKDEPMINTTLLEGSVKTRNVSSGESHILSPGQQSTVFKAGGSMRISKVNTENIISWKNGYFIFDNQEIASIMKVISRWYDVNVDYKRVNKDEKFGGTFSRSSDLTDILKVLKIVGNVDFKVEGRTIIVSDQSIRHEK